MAAFPAEVADGAGALPGFSCSVDVSVGAAVVGWGEAEIGDGAPVGERGGGFRVVRGEVLEGDGDGLPVG